MVSALSGIPDNPSRALTVPSCTHPCFCNQASAALINTVKSSVAAYSSARLQTTVFLISVTPLLTPTQPAAFKAAISASSSPLSFWVNAPTVNTMVRPAFLARSSINSTTAGLSITGSVSGGTASVVMPPATAARVSLSIVAVCSWPGSRSRALRSTRPGQTILLYASISISASNPAKSSAMATIFPSSI